MGPLLFVAGVLGWILGLAAVAALVMLLFPIIGFPAIGFWQAFGGVALLSLVVGLIRG